MTLLEQLSRLKSNLLVFAQLLLQIEKRGRENFERGMGWLEGVGYKQK
jgi:hypothetical protein